VLSRTKLKGETMKVIEVGTKVRIIDPITPETGTVIEIEDNEMFDEYMYLIKTQSGQEVLLRLHEFMIN